jgi:hypothetical protein
MTDNIVMTEEFVNDLRARNEERINQAKAMLGKKYLLHPANMVKKLKKVKKAVIK